MYRALGYTTSDKKTSLTFCLTLTRRYAVDTVVSSTRRCAHSQNARSPLQLSRQPLRRSPLPAPSATHLPAQPGQSCKMHDLT